jgi:hypothetical protein
MTDDRDDLTPDPDAAETEAERARARAFAKLVDGLVAGEPAPPALEAADRELYDTAALVRASVTDQPLDARRRQSLIDQAFGKALKLAPTPAPTDEVARVRARTEKPEVRGRGIGRAVPWAIAAVAVAAALAFALLRPTERTRTVETVVEKPAIEAHHRSRPADLLVGRIDKSKANRTSERIDLIVADRMAGYRELYLRGQKGGTP